MAISRDRCNKSRKDRRHPAVRANRERIIRLKNEASYLMRAKLDLVCGAREEDIAKEIELYNAQHGITYPSNPHGHAVHTEFCGYRPDTGAGCRFEHHNSTCGYKYGEEQSCRINARLVAITEELRRLSRELEQV